MSTPRLLSFRKIVLLTLVLVSMLSPLAGATAGFETNLGPDPADVGGTGNGVVGYAVATANYINLPYSYLKIYAKTNDIYVFIAASDLCEGEVGIAGLKDNYHTAADGGIVGNVPFGGIVTSYTLRGGMGPDTAYGRKRTQAYCQTAQGETQFPSAGDPKSTPLAGTTKRIRAQSNRTLNGRDDIYEFDLDAARETVCGGTGSSRCFFNSFRIKVLDAGNASNYGNGNDIWISQDTTKGADQFAINPGFAAGFYNYSVNFGPDCTVPAGGISKRITIYDDDNIFFNFIQRTWDPFHVQVQRQLRTGGPWEGIPLTRSSPAWNNNGSQANETDGNADNGPGAPAVGNNKRNYMIAGSDNIYVVGTDASKENIYLDFNVHPDYVYRFRTSRVWYHNNIQYKLPYPSVWGDPANLCQVRVEPRTAMPPDATVGNVVTPTFTAINNMPPGTGYDGSVDYIRRVWLAVNTDGDSSDAGESMLRQDPGWQGPVAVNDGNNATIPNAGWGTTATTGARYICASLQFRRASNNTIIEGTNPHHDCTSISKYPSFGVANGDVRTGGTFSGQPCNINLRAGSWDQQNHYYGIVAHDYGTLAGAPRHTYLRHASVATGTAYDLATNRLVPPGSAADMNLSFAWDGSASVAGEFHGDLIGTTGAFNTHCLSAVFDAGRYAAAASPTAINVGAPPQYIDPGTNSLTTRTYNIANGATLVLAGPGGGPLRVGPGQKVVVRVNNTGGGASVVRLASNIEYTGTATSIYQLPQFVLLVGTNDASRVDIRVDSGVSRLDGIYANRGGSNTNLSANFNTCTEKVGVAINASQCNNQLTVNGSVILGGRLNPYRTFGHDINTDVRPAEIFNLRSDTVLGDYARGSTAPRLEIMNQKELAPRF